MMPRRWGLGPVFLFEWLMISRRWQYYASRSLFVLLLEGGLAVVWWSQVRGTTIQNLRALAQVGQNFFYALIGVQITMVLLVGPAATAGSICIDKARGALLHLMVTDLSNAEIVLS